MPELPEVETVRRGLEKVLRGRRFAGVEVRRPDLRRPLPPQFAARLKGRKVTRIARRGKYLLFFLDDGAAMIGHLGMSGCMAIRAAGTVPGRHDHVIFSVAGGPAIHFNDPRRFGLFDLCAGESLADHPLLASLGMEPLDPEFTGERLAAALAGKAAPLKSALMDQRIVAGLGNIYVCEALFRAGLSPRRRAGTVTAKRAERLVAAIGAVLDAAIAAGGSSLRDHVRPDGELGYFQHAFAVYGRAGEPCPDCDCAAGIRRCVMSGRSTFFCAKRQR